MPQVVKEVDYKGTPCLEFEENGYKEIMGAKKIAFIVGNMTKVMEFLNVNGNGRSKEALEAFFAKYERRHVGGPVSTKPQLQPSK